MTWTTEDTGCYVYRAGSAPADYDAEFYVEFVQRVRGDDVEWDGPVSVRRLKQIAGPCKMVDLSDFEVVDFKSLTVDEQARINAAIDADVDEHRTFLRGDVAPLTPADVRDEVIDRDREIEGDR